jgi:hypothetical protein
VGLRGVQFERAWTTVRKLRAFYPGLLQSDRDPLQLLIAQLRYAAHTLGFDECNPWQKLWALHTAGHAAAAIKKRIAASGPLRVDWIVPNLGMTLLPGRRDYDRDLVTDILSLKQAGVTHVLCKRTRVTRLTGRGPVERAW